MEKLHATPYTIGPLTAKPKSLIEIPDRYNRYRKVVSNNVTASPLAFTLALGYIEALLSDNPDILKRITDSLSHNSLSNPIPGLAGLSASSNLLKWLESVCTEPKQLEHYVTLLSNDAFLQKELEGVLLEKCRIEGKFNTHCLPAVANLLQCQILFHCPYMYQKMLVTPEANSVATVVITMETENLFILYTSEAAPPNIRENYWEKKQKLKEHVIEQLVAERAENYAILQGTEIINPKAREKRLFELNETIDKLIELKESEGKKKRGKRSDLIDYLSQIKAENAKIIKGLSTLKQNLSKPADNEPVMHILQNPCMDCGKPNERITEFTCGHTACTNCMQTQINDLCHAHAGFAVKCPVPHCFHILSTAELEPFIKTPIAIFTKELLENPKADICMICQKKAQTTLHDQHSLCNTCLLSYIEHITDGEMVKVDTEKKTVSPIICPMAGCAKQVEYSVYEKTVPDMKELIKKAWRKAGVYEIELQKEEHSLEKIGKCYECGAIREIVRLHDSCTLCFCSSHCKKLGRDIVKNKSMIFDSVANYEHRYVH